MPTARSLHPAHLRLVAGELWVVDDVQPVAAIVDPGSGRLRRLVDWPQVPPWHEAPGTEWRCLSDEAALWVQSGHGPPARVTPDGGVAVATVRTAGSAEHWRLAAAGPSGAWLLGTPPVQDIAATPDAPPPHRGPSRLLVAAPDGEVREVVVRHPLHDVVGTADGVALQVDTGRGERRDIGAGSWSWEPEYEWLLVPWLDGAPQSISTATHRTVPAPRVSSARLVGRPFLRHDSALESGGTEPQRWDVAGGLRWELDGDASGGSPWSWVVTGRDPAGGRERIRARLGVGTVHGALGMPSALYVALAVPGRAGSVLAVDPADGTVTELLAAGSVDVSDACRRLGPPPADLDSYTRYWLSSWADDSGAARPVEHGMSDGRAELVGEWPHTAIEVTFRWAGRPGIRLRRRLPLFDELGRHTPPEYADVHLMEDLATGQLLKTRAASAAGVVDV